MEKAKSGNPQVDTQIGKLFTQLNTTLLVAAVALQTMQPNKMEHQWAGNSPTCVKINP